MEDGVHEIPGSIACKWTPGSIRSVGSGSEAENQHSSIEIPEPGHRLGPVLPIHVGASLDPAHLLPISNQPRAEGASDDRLIQLGN